MQIGRLVDQRRGERRAVARPGMREMGGETGMKYDAMGLLHSAAMALKKNRDDGTAFAVLELANNLRLLMRKSGTIDDFNKIYTGADGERFDIEALVPVRGRKS